MSPLGGVYAGPLDVIQKMIKAEGIRGFYRGLEANLIGVIPEKGIKLVSFYGTLHSPN
jgi:hypothetical protein